MSNSWCSGAIWPQNFSDSGFSLRLKGKQREIAQEVSASFRAAVLDTTCLWYCQLPLKILQNYFGGYTTRSWRKCFTPILLIAGPKIKDSTVILKKQELRTCRYESKISVYYRCRSLRYFCRKNNRWSCWCCRLWTLECFRRSMGKLQLFEILANDLNSVMNTCLGFWRGKLGWRWKNSFESVFLSLDQRSPRSFWVA